MVNNNIDVSIAKPRDCAFCGTAMPADVDIVSMKGAHGDNVRLWYCPGCFSWVQDEGKRQALSIKKELARQVKYHENEWSESTADEYAKAAEGIKQVIRENEAYFGNPGESYVYDIGAGRGNFLKALIDLGYDAEGCEPSSTLVAKARATFGLSEEQLQPMTAWEFCGYLERVGKKIDVVVLWHVLEHIPYSFRLLQKFAELSKNELTFVFQTPLPISRYMYPEHLFFPTIETYHDLAERLGLEIVFLKTVPYTRYITCIISGRVLKKRHVTKRETATSSAEAVAHHLERLDNCVDELLLVIERQRKKLSNMGQ